LKVKENSVGPEHYNMCISLSGLAYSYLAIKDFESATAEAKRMKRIALFNNLDEQQRIAYEILLDIYKVTWTFAL
jgi:hypothetical protein